MTKLFTSISSLDMKTRETLYEKLSAPDKGGWASFAGWSLRFWSVEMQVFSSVSYKKAIHLQLWASSVQESTNLSFSSRCSSSWRSLSFFEASSRRWKQWKFLTVEGFHDYTLTSSIERTGTSVPGRLNHLRERPYAPASGKTRPKSSFTSVVTFCKELSI